MLWVWKAHARGKEGGLWGGTETFRGLFCRAAALGQGDDFHVTALELVLAEGGCHPAAVSSDFFKLLLSVSSCAAVLGSEISQQRTMPAAGRSQAVRSQFPYTSVWSEVTARTETCFTDLCAREGAQV